MKRPRISLVRDYRPPVRWRRLERFANGFTVRFGRAALHVWYA